MNYTDPIQEAFNKEMEWLNSESKRINVMRKKVKLQFQKMCYHPQVVHIMGGLKPVYLAYQNPSIDDFVKVKTKCLICGKVL